MWFRHRDADGTVHHISVPLEPMPFIAFVGMAVAFTLPLLVAFRNSVAESPASIVVVISCLIATGFVMFSTAKISVIRSGRHVSFGSRWMTQRISWLYVSGYVLMLVGAGLVLLFVLVTHS